MLLFEREMVVPDFDPEGPLVGQLQRHVEKALPEGTVPVRLAVTGSCSDGQHVELGLLQLDGDEYRPASIFEYQQRSPSSAEDFNVVLLVPTGIGAEIGGHAGDAGPVASLLASVCDTLITHPNVVNASDINELPSNSLYVEGSVISRLLCGTVGLQRIRSNRVLVVIDDHPDPLFTNSAINTVNAARATYGLSCPQVIRMSRSPKLKARFASSGRAVGRVEQLRPICDALHDARRHYDAVAISSVIDVPHSFHTEYFQRQGGMVNPWGGVEAIFTHALSSIFNVPTAHAPMFESQEIANTDPGIVDPRMAAEAVSLTFLQCLLKGLHRSPKLVQIGEGTPGITAAHVSCLVVPRGCVGLPTLAALDQGIPVIEVSGNANIMRNNLSDLPWSHGQLFSVSSYCEAAGVIATLRSGIDPLTLQRPLTRVPVASSTETQTLADFDLGRDDHATMDHPV